jgi:hypothetical protein
MNAPKLHKHNVCGHCNKPCLASRAMIGQLRSECCDAQAFAKPNIGVPVLFVSEALFVEGRFWHTLQERGGDRVWEWCPQTGEVIQTIGEDG